MGRVVNEEIHKQLDMMYKKIEELENMIELLKIKQKYINSLEDKKEMGVNDES